MMRLALLLILLAPSAALAQPKVKSSLPDPYGYTDYNKFREAVNDGVRGKLVVGIEDKYVNTYTTHCRVPSGFEGLADGEYDCYEENGRAMMLQTVFQRKVADTIPFEKATSAQNVGTTRSGKQVTVQYPTPTYTVAPSTVKLGTIWTNDNCPPSG